MPLMPGLLRRRGQQSDVDIRRHSFLSPDSMGITIIVPDGRASEQIPRRPSAAEFLSPAGASEDGPDTSRASAETSATTPLQRSISPPVQEESNKHRRFSMLKFRHASDSQLSTRARLQAQRNEAAPPMPHREYLFTYYPASYIALTRILQPPKSSRPLLRWT